MSSKRDGDINLSEGQFPLTPAPEPEQHTKKPWDFDVWFVAQHGPRPSRLRAEHLRDRLKSMRINLASDESELQDIEEWEFRRTSALYAWQIKDSEKAQ